MHILTKPQVFYDDTHKQALGYQNPFHLKKAQRIKPTLYDGSVIAKNTCSDFHWDDDEETLILEEESRSKMLDKQNDPISIEKKIKISPIDYSIKSHTPVRVEAPSELPKIMSQEIMHIVANSVDILDVKKSCVNDCSKFLKLETELLKKKDFIEKEAYDKLVKTQSQEKDTVIRKLKDRIKSLSGKHSVENVKKDIDEIETINIELEHRMFKLDIEPISHMLKNNRDAHVVYIKKTIENADTLRGLVKCARKQNPSEPLLESTYVFTQHVQEMLVYVSQTSPSLPKPSEKLVAVTLMNKEKRVRFAEPVTSSSNIPKQTDSLKTKDSNKPLLTSTGEKPTTGLADQSLRQYMNK
ncbi:hypothetical protein Tco_1316956 [Tanacetum coccineum]